MCKNDLIKLLQTIEGNTDIVLWNGFVEGGVRLCMRIGTSPMRMKLKTHTEK